MKIPNASTMKTTISAACALALCACAPSPQADTAAPEGSLFASAPSRQWRLPDRIAEISGLAVSPDGRLFAHDDEIAAIYEIDPVAGGFVKVFALGEPPLAGDFEGLAITPTGDFWLTTSSGQLHRFREAGDGERTPFERFDSGLSEICNVEGLAYLAAQESLILACKSNMDREMRDRILLYRWPIGAERAEIWRDFPAREMAQAGGVRRFQPSSIEIDALSGRILLLSGIDGALLELDADGQVLSTRRLRSDHVQAEGVTTLHDGSLVIADEAGHGHVRRQALLSVYARVEE